MRGLIPGLGVGALALGLLVYLTVRPPGQAALIPSAWSLAAPLRLSFGPGIAAVTGWLPSLLHPFGFTLLLAATLAPTRAAALGAGALWWAVDVAAECAQHPLLATPLAAWLDDAGAPRVFAAYLRLGRFDPADLAATTAGAAAAILLLHTLRRWEIHHED